MTERNYLELLRNRRSEGKRVCVGLDPDIEKMKIPGDMPIHSVQEMQFRLCQQVVDATKHMALAYKIQYAFFAETGANVQITMLIQYIRKVAPTVPVILDFKRGDIGNTNKGYVGEAYRIHLADAITVHPYLGYTAMEPLLADPNKFAYVLCKTSNDNSGEFQDLVTQVPHAHIEKYGHESALFHEYVAWRVINYWNANHNVGLVVGATYPSELANIRSIVGDSAELLVPGFGSQGGDVPGSVAAGGECMLASSSSGIMFSENPTTAAEELEAQLLQAELELR